MENPDLPHLSLLGWGKHPENERLCCSQPQGSTQDNKLEAAEGARVGRGD